MITCPQCNAQNLPGMAYCENCGSPLPQQAPAPAASAPIIDAAPVQSPSTPDPVAVAMPQPVMPVDQPPPAPELNIPSPAAGANVVAAEPDAGSDASTVAPASAPVEAAPASVAAQAPAPAGPSDAPAVDQSAAPSVDQSSAAAPAPASAGTGALVITFPNGQTFTMQGDEVNVGRADVAQNWHPELDVIPYGGGAPDLGVSRHHARIVRQDGGYSVVDLGSTNGTYINGHAAAYNQPAALNDGDTLSFGALNTTVAIK